VGDLLGYARVSTFDQNPDLQRDALKAAGCFRVFTDKASGTLDNRKQLAKVLDQLRPGDTLVVWRLDRLGRSLTHLIETVTTLAERKIGFRSLTENIDTTTASGKLIFHIFGSIAEFERDLIRDRTMAGLAAARARGRIGGRPPALSPDKLAIARQMHASRRHTMQAIAKVVGVSRSTLYRHLAPTPPPPTPRKAVRPRKKAK
jgi:DNA invertase Pin-like site-specific DNA recombinase